jgi:acyl-CoA synthetase (AMP-forming)/AMP-acid ligase II
MDRRAEETPHASFIVGANGDVYSFLQTQRVAQVIASNLLKKGVCAGESVAYAAGNGSNTALTILGALYGGYLATAINLVAGQDTIAYVLEHSETRLVLVGSEARSLVDAACGTLCTAPELLTIDESLLRGDFVSLPAVEPSQDGVLMYTSGTTGRPKGVVLTHANILAGGANTVLAHALDAQDRALCVLPLYHINGLCVTLLAPLVSGGSVIIPPRFSVSQFWNTVVGNGATWVSLVPTQISYLLHEAGNRALLTQHQLRFARSASAPLSPDVQTAFERTFNLPIVETMGLTETAAQILSNPLPPAKRKMGSPGIAFGNDVIIADPVGQELSRGEQGEVWVRGSNVMRKYLHNEKATADAITADGWLCTGDLGRMDSDGFVFIVGRLKELIIKGGENIAPREIDEALYSRSEVIEAAAFGVQCKHYGERVEAGVVLSKNANLNEADLITHCIQKVGTFKAPDRVHILSELPKGPSGKIQRIKLAGMVS